jgi:hypothetical protein
MHLLEIWVGYLSWCGALKLGVCDDNVQLGS